MQKRSELDWVGYVLRDVVTFLAKNDMMDSATMLSVAAAHIEHDLKKRDAPASRVMQEPMASNVLAFPARTTSLN